MPSDDGPLTRAVVLDAALPGTPVARIEVRRITTAPLAGTASAPSTRWTTRRYLGYSSLEPGQEAEITVCGD